MSERAAASAFAYQGHADPRSLGGGNGVGRAGRGRGATARRPDRYKQRRSDQLDRMRSTRRAVAVPAACAAARVWSVRSQTELSGLTVDF